MGQLPLFRMLSHGMSVLSWLSDRQFGHTTPYREEREMTAQPSTIRTLTPNGSYRGAMGDTGLDRYMSDVDVYVLAVIGQYGQAGRYGAYVREGYNTRESVQNTAMRVVTEIARKWANEDEAVECEQWDVTASSGTSSTICTHMVANASCAYNTDKR